MYTNNYKKLDKNKLKYLIMPIRNFIEKNVNTIEENYYKNAVDNGEGVFTFSIPFDTG